MATGLLNNASSSFNMTADAVTADVTVAIEALSFVLGNNGEREIHGQLFVTVTTPAATSGTAVYTTVPVTSFIDGTLPLTYSDGVIPANQYTRIAAGFRSVEVETTARVDFTAALQDAAFEEHDIYGAPRTKESDRAQVRF